MRGETENNYDWIYTMGINLWADEMLFGKQSEPEPITEDAEYEVIEPKRLENESK